MLKTCPECGSENLFNDGMDYYWACDDCGAEWPEEIEEEVQDA
jgi:uncharacterized protein (DUF983 family)